MKKHSVVFTSILMCFLLSACGQKIQEMWVKEEHITEPLKYIEYFGNEGIHKSNALIRSSIFPGKLPESAHVEKFSYHYYDPFDRNFTNILIYTCDEDDFNAEKERLENITSSTELSYGATGFPYELCAVNADDYNGIIYAMADTDNLRLIYAEITFCNYFSDMDYISEIGTDYLPIDFNAQKGNPRRKEFEDSRNAGNKGKGQVLCMML